MQGGAQQRRGAGGGECVQSPDARPTPAPTLEGGAYALGSMAGGGSLPPVWQSVISKVVANSKASSLT